MIVTSSRRIINCHSVGFSQRSQAKQFQLASPWRQPQLRFFLFLSHSSLWWEMSLQHEPEQVANSGLGASEETSKLLVEPQGGNNNNSSSSNANLPRLQKAQSYSLPSSNGPTAKELVTQQSLSSGTSSGSKPVLIRQDRTSSYLTSPQLSALGTSEETSDDDNAKAISYQLMPSVPTNRCRTCRSNERRSSISPASVIYLPRSVSKESVGRLNPSTAVHHHSATIPPVYITGSPTSNSRIIRQSSQPEASTLSCCSGASCSHAHQTSSLRQLKDPSDQISGIAGDVLRVRIISDTQPKKAH